MHHPSIEMLQKRKGGKFYPDCWKKKMNRSNQNTQPTNEIAVSKRADIRSNIKMHLNLEYTE